MVVFIEFSFIHPKKHSSLFWIATVSLNEFYCLTKDKLKLFSKSNGIHFENFVKTKNYVTLKRQIETKAGTTPMTQKLIAIDLDGTTLNAQSLITPKTKAVLQETVKAGHIVSIATGRPFRMSEQFYQELGLTSPMVNFNGALVHLPHQIWSYETETLFSRDIVFDILAQKEELQLDYVAAENRDSFFVDRIDFEDSYLFSTEKPTEANLLSNLKSNPTSMLVQTTNAMADTVAKRLNEQYADYVDVRTWGGPKAVLEIVAKGIEKARGVKVIADALHIDRQNIIAFGDEHNDVEMLEYAGWGVAMANGSAGAKAAANDQTEKPNTEDGLADYLERNLLKKSTVKSA